MGNKWNMLRIWVYLDFIEVENICKTKFDRQMLCFTQLSFFEFWIANWLKSVKKPLKFYHLSICLFQNTKVDLILNESEDIRSHTWIKYFNIMHNPFDVGQKCFKTTVNVVVDFFADCVQIDWIYHFWNSTRVLNVHEGIGQLKQTWTITINHMKYEELIQFVANWPFSLT